MSALSAPGPWGLCDSSDARNKGYIRPLVLRDDATRPAVARICTTGYRWEEWQANARLIAAAPDLLAACKAALCLLGNDASVADVLSQIASAVAKAEGKGAE